MAAEEEETQRLQIQVLLVVLVVVAKVITRIRILIVSQERLDKMDSEAVEVEVDTMVVPAL